MIFSLTDETYSLLCSVKTPEGIDAGDMRFWIAMLDHSYWILGGVLGTIIGGILPFDTTGIDFAMTSLFTVIFVEQWQSTKCHIPALMGLAAAAVSLAILGPDNFILPAMLAICVMLVVCAAVWQRRSPDYDNRLCYRHDRRGSRLHVCNARRAVPAVQRLQAHPADHPIPRSTLPPAVIALLVVYCLKTSAG